MMPFRNLFTERPSNATVFDHYFVIHEYLLSDVVHAFCRVALEDEKNDKLHCHSNGFGRTIDTSEISLHSSATKISDEDAASRKGLHRQ